MRVIKPENGAQRERDQVGAIGSVSPIESETGPYDGRRPDQEE